MRSQPQTEEVAGSSRKRQAEDDLEPMVFWMEQRMSSLKQTIVNFNEPSGEAIQSAYFQGSTLFNLIITTPLGVEISNVGPHAQSRSSIPKPKKKGESKGQSPRSLRQLLQSQLSTSLARLVNPYLHPQSLQKILKPQS